MNTKQKLTLGIAAIFMVTLTIVGVTYAYFVTRVEGDGTSVEVTAAKLGDVVYVKGNDGENGSDILRIDEVIPGDATKDVVYKKFAVENMNTDANALSYYSVIVTNKTITDKNEFIHTADGNNETTGVKALCYAHNPEATLDATVTQPLTSTEALAADNEEDDTDAASVCFPQTAGESIYNNIAITLYEVDADTYNSATKLTDLTVDGEKVKAVGIKNTLTYKATDVISDRVEIAGTAANRDYYVLKVEYLDRDYNQNAENLAGLDIVVSIQAA